MFTVAGSTSQSFAIVATPTNFNIQTPNQWGLDFFSRPIWDTNGDNVSDVAQALQAEPALLFDNRIPFAGVVGPGVDTIYNTQFARSTIGVGSGNVLYFVVADGEGVHGGNGPTANKVGRTRSRGGVRISSQHEGDRLRRSGVI
jgi:hypothetical protein